MGGIKLIQMKLRTKIAVTHADVDKKLTGGTKDSVVTMDIERFVYDSDNGVQVPFTYTDADGNFLETNHPGNIFIVPASQVKGLSQSINSVLPAEDNIEDRMWAEIKVIAMNEMMNSFGITPGDIEEI